MVELSVEEFEAIVRASIDNIPEKYGDKIQNVAFIVEDTPSDYQKQQLHMVDGQLLFGLYEGIPLSKRSSGYNLVLPDKITIFRHPILLICNSVEQVQQQINKTVWHEVAHYFGLDHAQIAKLERR